MDVVMNLSEQTHLSEVVVSLLQSGELSQETLILSPLFIQLCPQSCIRLRHSLMHQFCTQMSTHRGERKKEFEIQSERKMQKKDRIMQNV